MAVDTIAQASEARAVQVKRSTDQARRDLEHDRGRLGGGEFDDGAMWSGGSPTRLTGPGGRLQGAAQRQPALRHHLERRAIARPHHEERGHFAGRAEDLDTVPTNRLTTRSRLTTGIDPRPAATTSSSSVGRTGRQPRAAPRAIHLVSTMRWWNGSRPPSAGRFPSTSPPTRAVPEPDRTRPLAWDAVVTTPRALVAR